MTATPEASARDPHRPVLAELRKGQVVRGRHRYQLHRQIGSGAFGAVWVAETVEADPEAADVPPKVVAIKFFNAATSTESSQFLRRELAALLSMRSECVPRVYDWAVNPRLSFFVMECYIHGTLNDLFDTATVLDDDGTWVLVVDLLRALKVAHRAGVLHLDIKPSNIMNDGRGGYLLLDFGISQASQTTHDAGQTIGAGSLGYQAPEQRRLELDRLDTRTDLWAVGATAWAVRTGCDLRQHPDRIRRDVHGAEPTLPPLSMEIPGVSDALDQLVSALLCDDPAARPGGAAEVLERIRRATGISVPRENLGVERRAPDAEEIRAVADSVMDPLWSSLLTRADFARYFMKFEDGEFLCQEGDPSYDAFLLLRGTVRIFRGERELEIDDQEGTFMGELSTLTGTTRSASMRAVGPVWVCVFNAAEFERLLAAHPAVSIRMLRLMAERLLRK